MKNTRSNNRGVENTATGGRATDKLADALAWHQAGEIQRAESAYRNLLSEQPDNHEALHLLGLLMQQSNRGQFAQQLLQAAIKLDNANDTYLFNLAEIQRAANDTRAAVDNYRHAIQLNTREADYFFGLGTALADCGEIAPAIEALQQAATLAPEDPQVNNNLGNVLAESGDPEQAIRYFERALASDPQYAEAQVNIGNAYKERGDLQSAITSYRRAVTLDPDHPQILMNLALGLEENGNCDEAVSVYRQCLEIDSELVEGWINLGRLLRELQQPENARQSYLAVLERDPQSLRALLGLAALDRDAGDYQCALGYYRQAVEYHPDDATGHSLLGDCLAKLDDYESALGHIDESLRIDAQSAEAHFNRGICMQALGRFDEALESHRQALALRADFAEAAYSLALIDSRSLDASALHQLELLSRDGAGDSNQRINLHFTLAKAYRDREMQDAAFEQLKAGNELKSHSSIFQPQEFEAYIERIIDSFDEPFFDQRRCYGVESELPVFIVGMPRSGSTLVEQVVSSHPQVHGAGELNEIRLLQKRLPELIGTQRGEPECVADLSAELADHLAGEHLHKLRLLSSEASRVCDKMLGNFLKLGLIYLLFPNARVIHCMRDPLDMGMSCYSQNFARGLKFTYRLEHIACAYRGYHRLMAHWRKVLPLRMLDVRYERLVSDQDKTSRELIEFCGLDWDPRCLEFHKQSRGVKTASFWQVRQPLYASSVGQWRRYQKQLEPLISTLGELTNEYWEKPN